MIRAAGLAGLLLATAAQAAPLEARNGGCGGNAYSSAQVVEGRPARKGPLVAVPDTLCADLDGPRPNVDIQLYGVPGLGGSSSGLGSEGGSAPYDVSPRRGARPYGDR